MSSENSTCICPNRKWPCNYESKKPNLKNCVRTCNIFNNNTTCGVDNNRYTQQILLSLNLKTIKKRIYFHSIIKCLASIISLKTTIILTTSMLTQI